MSTEVHADDDSLLSVAALHALVYCERLFFLEEVERIRLADARVFAGRRAHQELLPEDGEDGAFSRRRFESSTLGVCGSVDILRRRDGRLIPYEVKRGRSAGRPGAREAWATDRVQLGAYALLVEEAFGIGVEWGRVRYLADRITVTVAIDDQLRGEVRRAIARARVVRSSVERPAVTENARLCVHCSLAPVCLPEEARLAGDPSFEPIQLFPSHPEGKTIHVSEQGARVGLRGEQLTITLVDGSTTRLPIVEVGQLVLHGFVQVSTQAIRLCAEREIGVHWMTYGGGLVGSLAPGAQSAQRHLRQYAALSDPAFVLSVARRLVRAKVEGQLRYLMRASRGDERTAQLESCLNSIRRALASLGRTTDLAELLGVEGSAGAAYFAALPGLLSTDLDPRFAMRGRSRRPPEDRMNALLSYGYGMLYREVVQAIVAVGLHPGFGLYHQPRTAAHTLALDVMEIFRVPIVDMAIVAAVNRGTFDADEDFEEVPGRVLLSERGRRRAIEVIERRKQDTWKHTVVGYSISYARMIELEVRLLEKEWMGEGGLFARFRIR